MEEDEADHESASSSSLGSQPSSYAPSQPDAPSRRRSLAARVHRMLCVGDSHPLPVKWHRSAVNSMVELRDLLLRQRADAEHTVEQDVRMLLLYAGISVQRRVALGASTDETTDLQVSMALLLMLQILCDPPARSAAPSPLPLGDPDDGATAEGVAPEGAAPEGEEPVLGAPLPEKCPHEETLLRWNNTPLQALMQAVETEEEDDTWSAALRITPSLVCRACVAEAPKLGCSSLGRLSQLAHTFFRCSGLALQHSMLESQEPRDDRAAASKSFLTLGVADFVLDANDELKDAKLRAIVDSAESEAGQQVRFNL